MNILFVGQGQGSWEIRGKQIAKALGARATTAPTSEDWRWADVVVLVKRAIGDFGEAANGSGARIIWDVLDFWRQPEENQWPVAEIVGHVAMVRERFQVSTVIGATKAMADEIGGVYIPHHSRPGLRQGHLRKQIKTVAYEGTRKYLGSWRKALESACEELGLTFVVNPFSLAEADVVVAFRGEQWDGPICRRWKSGVKYVNAMAVGRPVLTQTCSASLEIHAPGWDVADPSGLIDAMISCQSWDYRAAVARECADRSHDFTLSAVADRYRALFRDVLERAA